MRTILQINLCAHAGSTGRLAEDIATAAIGRSWRSYIAAGRTIGEGASEIIRVGGKAGVYLHGLKTRLCDRHGFGSAAATRKLVGRMEQIRPDIVHLHNIHGYYLHIEVLFRYLASAGIPVVWTLHDCWPFTGHCAHFENAGCRKWESGCGPCPIKGNYPRSLLIDNSARNYRDKRKIFTSVGDMTFVCVSEWLGRSFQRSFLAGYPSMVIRNWVDTDLFRPRPAEHIRQRYGIGGELLILGVASVWTAAKRLHDLVKLYGLLGGRARMIVVGLSPRQAAALPPGITALPRTRNRDELAELYSAADIFVNPTYNDSSSLTNMEAQACGTPVVTYRTGAAAETVSGETGFVVDKGDVEALARACKKIYLNGKERYGAACRERAEALFSRRDRCADYIDLYDSLLR